MTQYLFLNYNLHLAHHREPQVPWIHLPHRVRPEDAEPSFWSIYWKLWLGPQPAPPLPPQAIQKKDYQGGDMP